MKNKINNFNPALWMFGGFLSSLVLVIYDCLHLFFGARDMFFSRHEMYVAMGLAAGLTVCAGAISGLITGILIAAKMSSKRLLVLRSVLFSGVLFYLFVLLTSGPSVSLIPGRYGIIFIAACISGAGLSAFFYITPKLVLKRRLFEVSLIFTSFFIATIFYFADLKILVRLYPAFHMALSVLAFVFMFWGFYLSLTKRVHTLRFFNFIKREPGSKSVPILLICFALLFVFSFSGKLSFDKIMKKLNVRFVLNEKTVFVKDVIYLTGAIFPKGKEKLIDIPQTTGKSDKTEISKSNTPLVILNDADIFLITVDAMRYDRLKVSGAKRDVAPNINKLAEKSVVFNRAYTPLPNTSYAISSLLTGKYTKPLFDVPGSPAMHETWPQILHKFHYDTAAFFNPAIFFIDKARFKPYVNAACGFIYKNLLSKLTPGQRVQAMIEYFEKRPDDKPVFSWVHFLEPHEPYEPYCPEFGDKPVDHYDCEIKTVDKALGTLFDYIDKKFQRAIIIVTSDHGEEFGEHGGKYHGSSLYDEQVRVPLVFYVPGVSHKVVKSPVSLVDVLGTVLDILDLPLPARVRSRSFAGFFKGNPDSMEVWSEAGDIEMIVKGDYKLICNRKNDLCSLFNLKKDKREMRSIAGRNTKKLNELKARLARWAKSHAQSELRPLQTKNGMRSWPPEIRAALYREKDYHVGLLKLLETSGDEKARQKAAALLYEAAVTAKDDLKKIKPESTEEALWLAAALVSLGEPAAVEKIKKSFHLLQKDTQLWRICSVCRLKAGDLDAAPQVTQVALQKGTRLNLRRTAVKLLGEKKIRKAGEALESLVNEYQLTLFAARAIALIGYRAAIPTLHKRFLRERFKDRKNVIKTALLQLGYDLDKQKYATY